MSETIEQIQQELKAHADSTFGANAAMLWNIWHTFEGNRLPRATISNNAVTIRDRAFDSFTKIIRE